METYEKQAKKLVRTLASSPEQNHARNDEYVTVESGTHFCFHYVLSNGIVILTLTEKAYPKRLAFDYIDEIRKEFLQSYGAQIESASRPYEFIRFDTFIQKTKKVYNDSKTQRNLQKLNSELKDVHSIMTKNINDVISRGERLESKFFFFFFFATLFLLVFHFVCFLIEKSIPETNAAFCAYFFVLNERVDVSQKSTRLSQESKRYAAQAKHANRMRVIRQYTPMGVVIVVVLFVWFVSRKMR